MKTKTTTIPVWFAVAGVFLSPFTLVAAPLNLSVFKGNYTGPMTLKAPGDPVQNGRATAVFVVPQSGANGTIRYRATVDGSGFPTVITLAANKRASVTDLLVGIAGTNNAKPGRGPWSQRQRVLNITANNGEGISLRGTAVVRDFSNHRELTLTLVSTDPGGSYRFSNTLRSRLP